MSLIINLKIFLFIILFCITKQIKIYGIIMLFCIAHECGHLLAGILLKQKIESISIMPFGLAIKFKTNIKDYNKKVEKANLLALKKIFIAIAGPLTNYIIALTYFLSKSNLLGIENNIAIYSNILILLFNLIPIYPLDGGRILKNILHIKFGRKKSCELIVTISRITLLIITALSSIIIYYYKNIAILCIIIYLWALTIVESEKMKKKLQMYMIVEKNVK